MSIESEQSDGAPLRILAIETSGRRGSIAALVADEAGVRLQRSTELSSEIRSARSLVPEIGSLLGDCGWAPRELSLVAVATGPGSFTGLRIGVTTAKTLAYATGAKLVGVDTLAAIAAGLDDTLTRRWAILDAQRDELFAACYPSGQISLPVEPQVIGVEAWLDQIQQGDVVAGPPLSKLELPPAVAAASAEKWMPQAELLGRLGFDAYQLGNIVDPMQMVPLYYRRSAAEEKAEAGP